MALSAAPLFPSHRSLTLAPWSSCAERFIVEPAREIEAQDRWIARHKKGRRALGTRRV